MNTGGMDTSGPPVSLAKASKAQQGGNFQSQRGAVEARLAHNQEVVGSTPTAATDVKPDRRAYDPPAGGRPVNYTQHGST